MAFIDMISEITGMTPKAPYDYGKKTVNRALQDVYRSSLWSFQLIESNWVSPIPVNAGTATTVQGQKTVTLDATAAAAVSAIGFFPSQVTQRQFRVSSNGTIYNIWGWDAVNTLTLDRPYQEPGKVNGGYSIYQVYYPSPFSDFKAWEQVRDMLNYNNLVLSRNREWGDMQDPQRSIYYIPTHCWAYQGDKNPNSATFQWMLWELWGQPTFELTYQLYGLRNGPPLVNPTDTVPIQIGEDVVIAKAKYYAFEWKEANRDAGDRSNYIRLKDDAMKEFKELKRDYRKNDRGLVDNFFTRCRTGGGADGFWGDPVYNSINGTANPGSPW